MPTIMIRTSPLPMRQRRAAALRITRWLANAGVNPSHVTVSFEEMLAGATFSGGMPVEALSPGHGNPAATVTCRISRDRDDGFRQGLASEIVRALPGGDQMPLIYIEFQPTSASDVWVATGGKLAPADQLPASTAVARHPVIGETPHE